MNKILFLSHGHPELSKGGAEVASWNLFRAFQDAGHDCVYLARTDGPAHGGSTFSARADDQVLIHTTMSDWFYFSSSNTKHLFNDLLSFVENYQPDIIHVHHYVHIGAEVLVALRRAVPEAKIIFTLHEFLAMCSHNGQMVKQGSMKLCYKENASDCSRCFPEHSPADFYLRKQYLLDQFKNVDQFVSPSKFLADRYIEWGLEAEKVQVIENVLPQTESLSPRALREGEGRTRFAFFGQLNQYKGIDVLLTAFAQLPEAVLEQVSLEIHGANLDKQSEEFQQKVEPLLESLHDTVVMRGSYESEQLPTLLAACDWVIIPSIWWENSPVVIQEAIAHGRPLIGSNIGGMKEKIEGIAGLTFEARSPASLASAIELAIEPDCFEYWQSRLEANSEALDQHLEMVC